MKVLKRLIKGRYSLNKTFWAFGIGGYFSINLIMLIVLNFIILTPLQAISIKATLRLALAVLVSLGLLAIYRKTLSVWSVIALLVFIAIAVINSILLFKMMAL